MAVGAVGDGAAVEGFGHEDKAPFVRASDVDDIFPELGRHALPEIGTEAIDTLKGLIGLGASCRKAGLFEPVGDIAGKIFPDRAGDSPVRSGSSFEIIPCHLVGF